MNKVLFAIIASLTLIFFSNSADAKSLTINEIFEGTCMVTSPDAITQLGISSYSIGSGTVIKQDGDSYYVLTNAHVVRDNNVPVYLNFFRKGNKLPAIEGRVVWRFLHNEQPIDLALIKVSKSYFKTFRPRVIPVAPPGTQIAVNTPIKGAGCPRGSWLQGWEARIIRLHSNNSIVDFSMFPEPGQSGSSLLADVKVNDEVHTMVAGLLTWREPTNRIGTGLSLDQIWRIVNFQPEARSAYKPVNYIEVAEVLCEHCGARKEDHIKQSIKIDNKEYTRLACPKCEHGLWANQNCPGGNCFPWRKNPQPNPQSPQTEPPTVILGDSSPTPGVSIDELTEEKKTLEQKLAELQAKKEEEIKDVQTTASEAVRQAEEMAQQKVAVAEEIVKESQEEKSLLEEKIEGLKEKITTLEELRKKVIEESNHYLDPIAGEGNGNILERFGLTGVGVAIGMWLWNMFGVKWVANNMTGWKYRLVVRLLKRIGIKKIRKILEKAENAQKDKKKIDLTVDSGYNTTEEVTHTDTNVILDKDDVDIPTEPAPDIMPDFDELEKEESHSTPQNNINVTQTVNLDGATLLYPFDQAKSLAPNDVFKNFMLNEEEQTELTVKHYYTLYKLYVEAIDLLKQGKLYHKPQLPIDNQKQTAEVLENWVRDQYVHYYDKIGAKASVAVFKEAYLGFLYKQAINELLAGTLYTSVLNGQATAEAIENYVNKRMVEKLQTI